MEIEERVKKLEQDNEQLKQRQDENEAQTGENFTKIKNLEEKTSLLYKVLEKQGIV